MFYFEAIDCELLNKDCHDGTVNSDGQTKLTCCQTCKESDIPEWNRNVRYYLKNELQDLLGIIVLYLFFVPDPATYTFSG